MDGKRFKWKDLDPLENPISFLIPKHMGVPTL
jgi:hypothetical protein